MSHPLDLLEPDYQPLLLLLHQNVNDSMLEEIAQADYGEDAREHLQKLNTFRNGVHEPIIFEGSLDWVPGEVLELVRWSEPDQPGWKPGSIGERGHWMRLFCCAMLLRMSAEPVSFSRFTGED